MRNHRFITAIGASAVAASLALAAFLIFPGDGARVEAATIFQSFRDAFRKAFVIRMENIVDEGFRLDGEVLVVLADEGEEPDPAADSIISGDLQEKGAYLDMSIRGEEASGAPGLAVDVVLAASQGSAWTYLKTDVPAELTQAEPFVAWLAGWAKDGLYIDLGDALQNEAMMSDLALDMTQDLEQNGAAARPGMKLKVGFGASADDEIIRQFESAGNDDATSSFSISIGTTVEDTASEGEGTAEAAEGNELTKRRVVQERAMHAGAQALGINYDEMVQLTELLNALFTGRMTAEQTDALVSWFERSAKDVTIVRRDDGLYVLTAARLDLSGLPMDDEALAELAQNSFEIGYRPETGVEYAAVLNVGTDGGKMVFEFVDRDIDDAVFDPSRYADDPAVRKLDLNKSFGGLFSGWKRQAESPADADEAGE